jgi:cell shape-determining protein MreD
MRSAAHVLAGYLLLLIAGAVWRLVPIDFAAPDLLAVFAVYLGLTARTVTVAGNIALRMAPATLASIVLGYLADLLSGTPRGTLALAAGLVCVAGQLVQRHLILRGLLASMALAFFAGLLSGLIVVLVRVWGGMTSGDSLREFGMLMASALLTGLLGPVVFRICRAIDARFARTARERDVTLGGLVP